MDYITVGEIVRAQGIAGEVKIKPLTASNERFKKLRVLYVDEKPLRVLGLRIDRDYVYVKLQGIDDRNAAEALRGKFVTIDRINAVELDDGEFFIADLIGCRLQTENGEVLGTVTDVLQHGAADVLCARGENGKEFRFPFLKRLLREADMERKLITLDAEKLGEVCVYDD